VTSKKFRSKLRWKQEKNYTGIDYNKYLPNSTWPENAVNLSCLDLDRDPLKKVVLRFNKVLDGEMR
jgi:hypothetical protein